MPSACLAISYASRRRPQMSTLSTDPPSLRTTLRKVSNDGATVRSSRVGARMTMISYGPMETSSPPMVVYAHGLFRDRRVTCVGNRPRLPDGDRGYEILLCRDARCDRAPQPGRAQPRGKPARWRVGGAVEHPARRIVHPSTPADQVF